MRKWTHSSPSPQTIPSPRRARRTRLRDGADDKRSEREKLIGFLGFQPLPDRCMIPPSGLHADSLGRIWALRGVDDGIVFDAYGYDGMLLGSARLEGLGDLQEIGPLWWSGSDCGLLAFTMDPLDYPRVYVFDLPGPEAFR